MAQVGDPHGIEHAVQVIDLMLHHARMEAIDRAIDGRATGIEALVAQPRVARHQAAHAGN